MEKKSNKLTIGLIVLIVVVVIVGIIAISGNGSTTSDANTEEPIENVTDMGALKQSEYTNDAFETVELGDSKSDVEGKMGTLTETDVESEYDVYSFEDGTTVYYFYFSGDKLENVSVFLTEE